MAKKINPAATIQLEAKHLMPTYKRPPLVFTHGKGCWVWDHRGKKYLDFLGGIAVNALGHAHPRLVRVVQREAARAIHVSNLFHNPYQGPLAAKLAKCSGLDRVFFTNSGTEAIEGALKLARLYARKKTGMDAPPAKTRILALENSFHGRTFGAVAITATAKYREPYEPVLPGAEFVRFNDVADLEAKFGDDVCAIVVETIQGEGGIHPVSETFWNRARELCTQHDCALVADEIQCGLGRTGRWFAYQKFASLPDIVTVAKPLAGGLPLGAFIANEQFAAAFAPGLHGTTFGGGPMICAAALEFLRAVEDEKLMANARTRGAELRAGLEKLAARFDFIREVRGEGLMLGVELAVDGNEYARQALKRGLIFNCTHDRVLRLLPPLIITAKDVREFLARFEAVLAETPRSQPSASHAPQARAAAR
jgi:acetylornithine aminotransferase/acetylornithine/N-succinyldiaminopimelate aminotransferase